MRVAGVSGKGPASRLRVLWPFLVVSAGAGAMPALTLTRGPYIGYPHDSSIAVVWTTDSPADSRLDFAPPGGAWTTIRLDLPTRKHVVRLDALTSGTVYRYRISSDGVPLAGESWFRAPRDSSQQRFRFAVIGDTNGVAVPSQIADRLTEADVDFAIHTGDVVYPSGAEEDYDPEFFVPFSRWLRHGPVLPTLGNHDIQSDLGAPFLANFVLPANDATGDSRFYAFRHANALFICLDVESSAFGAGSPQYDWLVRTLRESAATWKFVYFHAPLYSSANPNRLLRLILAPLFERYGVDVVFAGHEHLYERTHPIRDFVSSGPSVVYVTEGGGGAGLERQFHREDYSAYVASRFGFVEVAIDGRILSLTARDPDGSTFDSTVIEKQPAAPRIAPVPRVPARARTASVVGR